MTKIFADAALLAQAGLRKPYLYQAAEALRPGGAAYPMTIEQFLRWKDAD